MARPNTYPKKTSFPAGAGFLGDSDAGVFFMEANPLLAVTAENATEKTVIAVGPASSNIIAEGKTFPCIAGYTMSDTATTFAKNANYAISLCSFDLESIQSISAEAGYEFEILVRNKSTKVFGRITPYWKTSFSPDATILATYDLCKIRFRKTSITAISQTEAEGALSLTFNTITDSFITRLMEDESRIIAEGKTFPCIAGYTMNDTATTFGKNANYAISLCSFDLERIQSISATTGYEFEILVRNKSTKVFGRIAPYWKTSFATDATILATYDLCKIRFRKTSITAISQSEAEGALSITYKLGTNDLFLMDIGMCNLVCNERKFPCVANYNWNTAFTEIVPNTNYVISLCSFELARIKSISIATGFEFEMLFRNKSTKAYERVPTYWKTSFVNSNTLIQTYDLVRIRARKSPIAAITETELLDAITIAYNDGVQEYFSVAMSDFIEDVYKKSTASCTSLLLISDSHEKADAEGLRRSGEFLQNVSYFCKNYETDAICHLGDIVALANAGTMSDDEIIAEIGSILQRLSKANDTLLVTNGNHDGAGANVFTRANWYRINGRRNRKIGNVHFNDSDQYFYWDEPNTKLRVIFISMPDDVGNGYSYAGWARPQLEFISKSLDTMPNDYNVLLMSHCSCLIPYTLDGTQQLTDSSEFFDLVNAFSNHQDYQSGTYTNVKGTYSTKTGKILSYICGHYHEDYVVYPGETVSKGAQFSFTNGLQFPVVTLGATAFINGSGTLTITDGGDTRTSECPTRTDFTASQDLWTLLIYDKTASKLKFLRFGAGNGLEIDV